MTEPAIPAPVVLIGAARSGTKYLRDVLNASGALARVPYDVNYIWRFGQKDLPHDHLDPATLTEKQRRFIRRELARLSKRKGTEAILEKTVSNTLRVPFVEAVLPGARYVHLIRDGRDVTESAMRLWQAPPDWRALWTKLRALPLANLGYVAWFAKNFLRGRAKGRQGGSIWGPRFKGAAEMAKTAPLADICATQWAVSVETAHADLANIPSDRVFEIRYEDLVAGTEALEALIDWLGLPDADAVLARHAAELRPPRPAKWCELPDTDRSAITRITAPVLGRLGYCP